MSNRPSASRRRVNAVHRGASTVRRLRAGVALLLAVGASGCASAALQYGRDGLAPVDREVRSSLVSGRFGTAFETAHAKDAGARDRLLRALSIGTLGLYAGRTDSSVWALDHAWSLAEDRWTKHLSAGAASAVVNDYVLPYTPGRTERLFIPFYGALGWLANGARDDAAVEARRLVQLLGEASTDGGGAVDGEVRGLMHYVAGAVFESAGERDAADVAYRNAERLVRVPVVRDSTVPDSLLGDVVVVVEQGFVGHPVPRDETVWVSQGEYTGLRVRDSDQPHRIAQTIGVREGMRAWAPFYGPAFSTPRFDVGLSVSWSEFRQPRAPASSITVSSAAVAEPLAAGSNVTRAVRADFERGQPARFARAVLRAATRATLYKAASDQLSKIGDDESDHPRPRTNRSGSSRNGNSADQAASKDDDNGKALASIGRAVLGLGLFVAAATSQVNDVPDLRSWNVLPNDIRVVRLRVPAGEQDVRAVVNGQQVVVGRATVRRGGVTVLSYREFGVSSR